jgi:hypothetical protein
MYKYIQRDATVSWLLFQELYQELYMFRAFIMPIIRSNVTAYAAVGITCECGIVKCSVRLQLGHCDVTTYQLGQPYRTLHFTSQHSHVIPMAAYLVMLLLMMDVVNVRNMSSS